MKLIDVTMWWNDAESHTDHVGEPQVKILDYSASGNSKFGYLTSSTGACCGGWRSAGGAACSP